MLIYQRRGSRKTVEKSPIVKHRSELRNGKHYQRESKAPQTEPNAVTTLRFRRQINDIQTLLDLHPSSEPKTPGSVERLREAAKLKRPWPIFSLRLPGAGRAKGQESGKKSPANYRSTERKPPDILYIFT